MADRITSYNVCYTKLLRLSGYLAPEKLAIARHHLWPRQLERAGVVKDKSYNFV